MSRLPAAGRALRRPFDDLVRALEPLLDDPRGARAWALAAAGAVGAWFVYVPLHELLHVLGCVATGGSVQELELQRIYGGALLAELLPFVVPGGDYAGRLTGFDTGGSDWVYAATDLGPFAISVFPGVAWLHACAKRSRPLLFGPAVLLATAPFTNVTGDYFELASLGTTWVLAAFVPGGLPAVEGLRSDDVFRTWSGIADGTLAGALGAAGAWAWSGLTLVIGVALAFGTYGVGVLVSERIGGGGAEPAERRDGAADC